MTIKCRLIKHDSDHYGSDYELIFHDTDTGFSDVIRLRKDELVTVMNTIAKELATASIYDKTQDKWINVKPYSKDDHDDNVKE
jgi:hypothetical protein